MESVREREKGGGVEKTERKRDRGNRDRVDGERKRKRQKDS